MPITFEELKEMAFTCEKCVSYFLSFNKYLSNKLSLSKCISYLLNLSKYASNLGNLFYLVLWYPRGVHLM